LFTRICKKLYYDPKTGFISANKLYHKAKDNNDSITLKQVKEWYAKQIDIQRFQDQKQTLPHFKIASHNPNSWQMDLAFYKKVPYLTVININSRIGYAKVLSNKKATTVFTALKQFIRTHKVEIITSDNGKEFLNKTLQEYFKSNNIEHFNNEPGDHNTMGKIERFNRTLKQRLIKINPPKLTQKLLMDVIANYNSTEHSAIKATPNQMKGKVIESDIKHNQELSRDVSNEFVVGDSVLYKLKPKTFDKESAKWSKTVYTIVGIDGYRLQIRSKNNHTLYKPHGELKLVQADATVAPVEKNQVWEVEKIVEHKKLKSGKNKYLIKWVGFEEPTWETQDNLRLVNKNKMSAIENKYWAESNTAR
jgi:transposase InsO family protein